jgi:hypothetical protein
MQIFSFAKGGEDVVAPTSGAPFNWDDAASHVREQLNDALNARHVAFLLGSGCSSLSHEDAQVGVPTMASMAKLYLAQVGGEDDALYVTLAERKALMDVLGIDISDAEYEGNLERLMEVLFSFQFTLKRSANAQLRDALKTVEGVARKITRYVSLTCLEGPFSKGDETVLRLYESFYRKLIYRDRALPRPWIFTTNYDLFNETAMDRIGTPYCNGFSGTVERRFNPATFRYSLAEQMDVSSQRWTSVESYVYLCKLHGSISWIEEGKGLFPIREVQANAIDQSARVMIYPTPAKQSASFGSPYSDLFREFQGRIVREQSVLFVLGYSFRDEHVNNIIFQALTVPTFRLVAFVSPASGGTVTALRQLADPRIWLIGGDGPSATRKAHYFDTFIEKFMPEPPGDKVDTAVAKVLHSLLTKQDKQQLEGGNE